MSKKAFEIVAEHIVDRGSNITTMTAGLASIKGKEKSQFKDEGAYYLSLASRASSEMSGLAALADHVVSPINPAVTSAAGKVSVWTGVASSAAAVTSDLREYGVVKDSTLIGSGASLGGLGMLVASSPPLAIGFGVAVIGFTIYSLMVHPDDERITAMVSDLIEKASDAANSIADKVPPNKYVDLVSSMSIPYGDSIIGLPYNKSVSSEVNNNFNDAHGFMPRIDPLAIDLNSDGVQTISVDSGVLFDFNDDQMRTGTGRLDANDGFLVYDRNGNGIIDNGSELFGVDTRKSDGNLANDGLDALRDLDSNGDGVFNSSDNEFGNVQIWQDKNSDGISQADELKTLDELDITAINLDSQETNINSNGNRIAATGTVEFADGSISTAANLDLSSNPFYRKYTDIIEISEEIAALPDMQGSGAVRDLRQAASLNTELAQLLEQYAHSKAYAEQRALLDNMVSAWAKSSGYANLFDRLEALSSGKAGEPKAAFMHSWLMQLREPNASELAQHSLLEKIAILEAFNVRDFYNFTLQENGSLHIAAGSNVSSTVKPPSGKDVIVTETHLAINPEQAALLDKAYQTLLDSVYDALLPQTRLKPYLDAVSLKWNGTDIAFDYSSVIQQLNRTSQHSAVEAVLLGFELKQLLSDSTFDQAFKLERINWISGLDSEQLTELNKYLFNSRFLAENESLYDKPLNIGTSGDDIIYGSAIHNNELYGGKGDDTLYGGYGSDIYLFKKVMILSMVVLAAINYTVAQEMIY